jgi:glyoxylase-like metal-dependent hydrolase (beta-lactamase superfamily II)
VTDDAIFTGDAYIPGIAVVTSLPKGNKEQAQQSVQKILDLASGRTIYPDHKLP